jgi:hexosaminidase
MTLRMMLAGIALGAPVSIASAAPAPSAPAAPSIVPIPAKLTSKAGTFALTKATSIQAPEALSGIAERLRDDLRPATTFPLSIAAKASGSRIVLALDPGLKRLGDEGYRLSVTRKEVVIRAPKPAGVFYGVQTFRQLLPPATLRKSAVTEVPFSAPCVEIEDQPRFGWRGSHLDVGRHFVPKAAILKHLDLLALHKMNVFHWHLTEDQGWRIEIKKYPKLTEVGAFRKDSALGPVPPKEKDGTRKWKFRGKPHGGFYSQDDVREIVRYASERFITVVPEIEMPGHARAALAAYPEFGNTGKPQEVATYWGVFTEVFGVEDKSLKFLHDVLEEVLELFPSKFIHIGADEVPKDEWKASPAAQARMKALGLKDEHELQSWFVRQMGAWLAERGRRLVGWEEILEGGLAPGATVMSWRSAKPGIEAAKLGHDAIMAPKNPTYFDFYQSKDPGEPIAIGGHNPLEAVYAFEPIPPELPADKHKHILGGQAQIWTEYMPNPRHVEYMAWPRLTALSEAVWSPAQARSWDGFRQRLTTHLQRLRALDVNFRPLEGPLPGATLIP